MEGLKISRVRCAIGLLLAVCLAASPLSAQTLTTGTLSGTIVDQQSGALPGVTITAVHEPTGTQYTAVTDGSGRYQILNVRVGGPYTVTAALSGFADQKQSDVTVTLGEARNVDLRMGVAAVSETITVVGQSVFSETRAGTAANVSQGALEALPTISRSLTDMARTSPYFNEANSNGGDSFLSVAGRNNRYNAISIDGAVNNDVFGLAASGTPGGQTGTQPIGYDAIQELQLVVAPYDVRQGMFSGGAVNAITKSGSNSYSGSAFFYSRSQSLVGTIPSVTDSSVDTKVGNFNDRSGGFSLGGPIVRNKAFFFSNLDLGRKQTPNGWSANGSSSQNFGHQAEVERFINILQNTYHYDPGGLDEFSKRGNSDKIFVRTDFNLGTNHQLTVRNNYVYGIADQSGTTPTQLVYIMPGNFYAIGDRLTSTVGQLNSTFNNMYNELRITYQRERNKRDPGQAFPHIQVDLSDAVSNLRAGAELSSQANELDQDIWEFTDDLTLLRGSHTITLGTHNEFFKFRNLFIQNRWGQYRFASLDLLQQGIAGLYNYNYSNTSDPLQAARFRVRQFGFYAGDQWRARPNLTLTYGMRFDIPVFPDEPTANPVAVNSFGYATNVTPAPTMYSPRVGFNWDLTGTAKRRQQIRGGVGLFSGRTPYVWLSNQYSNTGVDFTAINTGAFAAAKSIPFVADPNNQPKSVVGSAAGNQTINVIDPDYKFPSVFRGNLASDHQFGFGLVGTAEVLFTSNVKEIKYQNLNYVQNRTLPDGRPGYTKMVSTVNDVVLLTNTDQGGQWSISYKLDRSFRNGFLAGGSYLYGRAESIMDGTSSVAYSNWAGTYVDGDINNPALRTSDFDVRHRINLNAVVPIPLWKQLTSYASLYFNSQSGRGYTIVANTDVNSDGRTTNDLIFVPATQDQVLVTNGTWATLDSFLANDDATRDYRGQIVPRNAGRAPWRNEMSVTYAVNIPTGGKTKVDLRMDISNLLNMLNAEKGWIWYPNFGGPTIIPITVDAATGKYVYNVATISAPTFRTFTRDDLRSRWQMQWGARVRF